MHLKLSFNILTKKNSLTVTLTEPTHHTVVLASRFIIFYNVQYTKI